MESNLPTPSPSTLNTSGIETSSTATAADALVLAQETDVWWGGYSGWTMVPGFALCLAATVAVVVVVEFWRLDFNTPELVARYAAYLIVGPIWLVQLSVWIYRLATRTYRLTTRRLFLEHSLLRKPMDVIDLEQVRDVTAEYPMWLRHVHIGRVVIAQGQHARRRYVLEGIRDPEKIAALIRETATEATHAR